MLSLEQGGDARSGSAGAGGTPAAQLSKQQGIDPQLGELLLDVQAGLGKLVRSGQGSAAQVRGIAPVVLPELCCAAGAGLLCCHVGQVNMINALVKLASEGPIYVLCFCM